MPCASWIGLLPPAVCDPKISIMPTTVPSSPISGDIAAMVPSVVRKRSSSCVTTRPTSSIASFITGRGLRAFARPAASRRPSGARWAVFRRSSGVAPTCRYSASTWSTMPGGAMTDGAQRPESLENDRERDDGGREERPDGPTGRLDDRPHVYVSPDAKSAAL